MGIRRDRIVHISEGVDTEYLQDIPRAQARRRLNLPLDRPMLVGVNDADMARAVRIFHGVLKQVPDALYVIVGKPNRSAQAEVERLGIQASVHFSGWSADEDYPVYLSSADAMFLPFRDNLGNRARFPAKLLDYLACGRPVVTSPVGEVADVYRGAEVGIPVGQDDEEMSASTARLLRDRETIDHMGRNARRLMVDRWEWKLRGAQIAEVVDGRR
jgi:glycosyltransferase involved in cell wall biosynthesis